MLTIPACDIIQQQEPTQSELRLRETKAELKKIRQAAKDCSSMVWEGKVMRYSWRKKDYVYDTATFDIPAEDAAVLRDLVCNKLRAVEESIGTVLFLDYTPHRFCTLHFLDAQGNTIERLADGSIAEESSADPYGRYFLRCYALPDAEYETWKKLQPADLDRRYEAAKAEWKRRHPDLD